MIEIVQPPDSPANPYTRLLSQGISALSAISVVPYSEQKLNSGKGVVWHLHWPDPVVRHRSFVASAVHAIFYLLRVSYVRMRGTQVVWTLHNLMSHDSPHPRLEGWFRNRLCALLDGWISMSLSVKRTAEDLYPVLRTKPVAVIPHGHYKGVYPNTVCRVEARKRLNLPEDSQVVLFFGAVRPYKNVPLLAQAFSALKDSKLRLVVAGSCKDDDIRRELISIAKREGRINLHLEFVPDDEAQIYLNASDIAVLPFREIANSGSALLLLSFGIPIVVPDRGSMTELAELVGDEWVFVYEGQLTRSVLQTGLDWRFDTSRGDEPDLGMLDWSSIAADTVAFYRDICDGVNDNVVK